MSDRPFSVEERDRLAEISALDLEAARPGFERIARLTQSLAGAPMAHIGILQADRIWIAGVSDEVLPPIPRQHIFSETAIRQGQPLWIEDLSLDERFRGNPFVAEPHHFRFIAGAPIRLSSGACIGLLSIIDRKPRAYDSVLADRLADFAALVADDCERRRVLRVVVEREMRKPGGQREPDGHHRFRAGGAGDDGPRPEHPSRQHALA